MHIYTSTVLTFVAKVVVQTYVQTTRCRVLRFKPCCKIQQQHRLHHQPAAAPALRARLGRVFPLLLSSKVYQLIIRVARRRTDCFPVKVMVFSQLTCLYFRACPV